MQVRLERAEADPESAVEILATERIRCPLLDENRDCSLYPFRPITCRVYGIPTKVQGQARVCGLAGFEKGKAYPVYDLDALYRDLHDLSKALLEKAGSADPEKADLLFSVSKALTTPLEELIQGTLEAPGESPEHGPSGDAG
jgi:hypothetical protein